MPIKPDQFGGVPATKDEPGDGPKKRKRRTKAELMDAAVIPGDTDEVEVKFTHTGTTSTRAWLKAVELFRDEKVEFVDPLMKYAVEKMDLQKAAVNGEEPPAPSKGESPLEVLIVRWNDLQVQLDNIGSDEGDKIRALSEEAQHVREQIVAAGGEDPESDGFIAATPTQPDLGEDSGKKGDEHIPPEAQVGDEVVRDSGDVYYVGHGHVLVQHPPSKDDEFIQPSARWVRVGDEWMHGDPVGFQKPVVAKLDEAKERMQTTNGHIDADAQQVSTLVWKVSAGFLEKIGLPEYSSLQIGPTSAQRHVMDDGRRTVVSQHGREISIPTSVVEAMQEASQVCEYVMRAERQAMINFLESAKPGSTKPQ